MILKTDDDETMIICAVRYALPRQSYMPHLVAEWLRGHWLDLSVKTRSIIIRDIRESIDRGECGSDSIDKPMWARLLVDLEQFFLDKKEPTA